jgi:hypothetical protein
MPVPKLVKNGNNSLLGIHNQSWSMLGIHAFKAGMSIGCCASGRELAGCGYWEGSEIIGFHSNSERSFSVCLVMYCITKTVTSL